jgi:hypothetical protein
MLSKQLNANTQMKIAELANVSKKLEKAGIITNKITTTETTRRIPCFCCLDFSMYSASSGPTAASNSNPD